MGARGLVLKSDALRDVIHGVRAVARGKPFHSRRAGALLAVDSPGGAALNLRATLTSRELQVLELLAEGKTNKQAAAALGVSVRTVEAHRASLMKKLDLHSLRDLIYFAIRHRIEGSESARFELNAEVEAKLLRNSTNTAPHMDRDINPKAGRLDAIPSVADVGFGISPGSRFHGRTETLRQVDASDFVNLALTPIPSKLGRLVLLADHAGSCHRSAGGNGLYGKEQIDEALRQKHHEVFFAWLGLSLTAQMEDVAEYLANEGGNNDTTVAKLIHQWVQEKSYERLRPTAAGESEWRLFSGDLQAILRLLLRRGFSEESHRA